MPALLEASIRFPTVIFTIGLGVCLVYWLFVLIGALDIDLFHGHVDLDLDVTGSVKGAAEAAKGAHADVDGGFWDALGLATVPITVSFSVVMLLAWTLSVVGMHYVQPEIGSLGGWFAGIVLVVGLLLALVIGGVAVRPLAPVFRVNVGKSNKDYVGATCTITTGHVDDDFGQATIEDGGTVLVIPVRCDRPGALARGQRALVIDFDQARHAYVVEPADAFMGDVPKE
jgi:hypothetical protein